MRGRFLLCCLTGVAASAAQAGDLAITPVRLELSARQTVATVKVRNAGATPTSLQMQVFAWRQVDGQDVLERTDSVLANPGAFDLQPGAEQLARIGLRAPPSSAAASYRVLIQELPRHDQGRPGEIATLLRVSVPIFVEPQHAPPRLDWTLERKGADGPTLLVSNAGTAHVQVTHLAIFDGRGRAVIDRDLSVYVLPGAAQRISLPGLAATAGQSLTVRAATDGPTVSAFLVVPLDEDAKARR